MGDAYPAQRAARFHNPAYRAQAGYAGTAPVYVSPDGGIIVDQFTDRPGEVHIDATVAGSVSVSLPVGQALDMATAILGRLHSKKALLPPVELSFMLSRHRPVTVPPCRVCGHAMSIASMGGGQATKYVCDSPEASMFGRGNLWGADADAAFEHRRRSEEMVAYHGDSDVERALVELRNLRVLLGEDMTVPVGELHYPGGHGKNICCWNRVRHDGGGVWVRDTDFEFTHDPPHATLESTPDEVPE